MPRLKLTLAYVGTHYHGWQIQAWKEQENPPTVQAKMEEVVSHIVGTHVHVLAASRTDSGVHADAQVAHCDIPEQKAGLDWQLALNTLLPRDIRVVEASLTRPDFNACFDAIKKAYTYRLWLSLRYTPPKLFPFVWTCGPVDVEKMDKAMGYLRGKQDFKSMQNAGTPIKTTEREIFALTRSPEGLLEEGQHGLELYFEGSGFLKQMVRNMVGLIVAAGKGKIDPDSVPEILAARDRRKAPVTAPPQGLTLSKIWYPE